MKHFVWFFAILLLLYAFNPVFAVQENLIPTTKPHFPESIKIGEKAAFYLKMSNLGYDRVSDIEPIITIMPKDASEFVHVEINPQISTLWYGYYQTTKGTIYVDKGIPVDRIFVSVSFMGNNQFGEQVSLTSDSTFNASIKIETETEQILDKDSCNDLSKYQSSPIELEYKIDGGKVVAICHSKDTNSVVTKIDAESDGQLIITIPKNLLYSLSSTDCTKYSDLMILIDNEEVLPIKSIHSKKDNTITVEFSKGTHTIEFVGFSIMPDPSPSQYCGIVMGFDSLYLPPKFQIERGMNVEQIRCNEGLVLLKKASNDNPACVKPDTLEKLRERGWMSPLGEIIKQRVGQTSQDLAENHDAQKVFLNGFKDSYEINEPSS